MASVGVIFPPWFPPEQFRGAVGDLPKTVAFMNSGSGKTASAKAALRRRSRP